MRRIEIIVETFQLPFDVSKRLCTRADSKGDDEQEYPNQVIEVMQNSFHSGHVNSFQPPKRGKCSFGGRHVFSPPTKV